MQDLYTNRKSKSDFVINGFNHYVEQEMDVFIASAFFTEIDVINKLIEKKCHVRIIVRLGFPTSPYALEKLLKCNNVEARFYTSHSFHPKMYIFGDKNILVGSANLTTSAITTNQEIVVGINSNDSRFEELLLLFSEYWDEAEVLNEESIITYKEIYNKFNQASKLVKELNDEVVDNLGDKNFSNIDRGKKKLNKKLIFVDSYKKSYQEFVTAFNEIQKTYKNKGRKVIEKNIPLRLEINSFISFVRSHHAKRDDWKLPSLGWDHDKKLLLNNLIDEWMNIKWPYLDDGTIQEDYSLINKVFGSARSIELASEEELVDGLCMLHSFNNRLRFFKGGLETLKNKFLEDNDIQRIKGSFTHLLYGEGDIANRMADCIFDETYKLNEFGQANVQELVGWIGKENLPVINGRTTKILRYFGFNVRQLS